MAYDRRASSACAAAGFLEDPIRTTLPIDGGWWGIITDPYGAHSVHFDASGVSTVNAVVQPGMVKVWVVLEPTSAEFEVPFMPVPSRSEDWNSGSCLVGSKRYTFSTYTLEYGDAM